MYFEIIVNSKYYLLHCVSVLSEEVDVFNSCQIALSSSSQNFTKLNQNWQWGEITFEVIKVAQINYVSKNKLHCTANLNFGLMCKKAKRCWALSTNFSFLFSWSWSCFASCWIGAKIQILQNSCMTKWFYETELLEIYL